MTRLSHDNKETQMTGQHEPQWKQTTTKTTTYSFYSNYLTVYARMSIHINKYVFCILIILLFHFLNNDHNSFVFLYNEIK